MRWSIAAVAALVALAGCSDGASPPVDDVEPPSEGKGSIYGVVVDGTITPLSNVTITLQGMDQKARSDHDGTFKFQDLEPGSYFMVASGKGITPVQTSAEVKAGEVEKVKVQVALIPEGEPYHRSNIFTARHATSVPLLVVYYVSPTTEVDGPFESVVYEADWSQSSLVFYPLDDQPYYHRLAAGAWDHNGRTAEQGVVVYNGTDYDPDAEGADAMNLWAWPSGTFGVALDAKAEVFLTIFYHDAAPDGWSIMEGTGTPG